MSALDGDNVVTISERAPWYKGESLMEILETVEIASDKNTEDFRFPVQYVNRPNLDFRGFCGTVSSGIVKTGDAIKVLPSQKNSKVKSIVTYDGDLPEAHIGQAVTLTLEDEIDVSRGDIIVHSESDVAFTKDLNAHLVWMSDTPMQPGKSFLLKFASKVTPGFVTGIDYRVDVNTFEHSQVDNMQLNDIAKVQVHLEQEVVVDNYEQNRATGAFIVIDRLTNITVAAGMVDEALESQAQSIASDYSAFELELNALVRKHFPHWDAKDISIFKK